MFEAVRTDLVSTIGLKRSTQNLQLSTSSPADYPIFGIVGSSAIVECVDLQTGEVVEGWRNLPPSLSDVPPVPPWRRSAWHKKLLKEVANAVAPRRNVAASISFHASS
jgi:hypothetical protein